MDKTYQTSDLNLSASSRRRFPCPHRGSLVEWRRGADVQIDDIIWIPQFVQKLEQKHSVTTEEVEEVLLHQPRVRFLCKGHRRNEDVYAATGRTQAGRYLIVVFILKPRNTALVVSTRDMDRKERARFARK